MHRTLAYSTATVLGLGATATVLLAQHKPGVDSAQANAQAALLLAQDTGDNAPAPALDAGATDAFDPAGGFFDPDPGQAGGQPIDLDFQGLAFRTAPKAKASQAYGLVQGSAKAHQGPPRLVSGAPLGPIDLSKELVGTNGLGGPLGFFGSSSKSSKDEEAHDIVEEVLEPVVEHPEDDGPTTHDPDYTDPEGPQDSNTSGDSDMVVVPSPSAAIAGLLGLGAMGMRRRRD